MLIIAVIPAVVLGGFYYQYFSGVLLSNVQQQELQNNSQIIYSVDNFFNSIFKISDSLLMNEELIDRPMISMRKSGTKRLPVKRGRKYWWECTKTVWCTHSPTQPAPIA